MRARFESFGSGPLLCPSSAPSPRISKQYKRRGLMAIHLPRYLRNDLFSESMRQILNLPSTQGFCDNKPAGREFRHFRCGWVIGILPHTSGIKASLMPPSFRKCGKNQRPPTRQSFLTTKPQVSRDLNIGVLRGFTIFPALPKSHLKMIRFPPSPTDQRNATG